jgi:hypothetical protein
MAMPAAERTAILRSRFTDATLEAGLLTDDGEARYAGYARQPIAFTEPAGRDDGAVTVMNREPLRWAELPSGVMFRWAGWFVVDADGHIRNSETFTVGRMAQPGDEPKIRAGDAVIGMREAESGGNRVSGDGARVRAVQSAR